MKRVTASEPELCEIHPHFSRVFRGRDRFLLLRLRRRWSRNRFHWRGRLRGSRRLLGGRRRRCRNVRRGGTWRCFWISRYFGDDFFRSGFADGAGGIPDAALRESKFATAGAGVRIEAVKNGLFLFRRKFGEVDAGQFSGAIGVCEKDFALVLERFDFGHDGHAEQSANFGFVNRGIPEANVFLDDAAFGVQNERRR